MSSNLLSEYVYIANLTYNIFTIEYSRALKKQIPDDLRLGVLSLFGAIEELEKDHKNSMTQIASYVNSPLPTITFQVDQLIKSGYLVKEKNPDDKRMTFIYMTSKATKTYGDIKKFALGLVTFLKDNLSKKDTIALFAIVDKVLKTLNIDHKVSFKPLKIKQSREQINLGLTRLHLFIQNEDSKFFEDEKILINHKDAEFLLYHYLMPANLNLSSKQIAVELHMTYTTMMSYINTLEAKQMIKRASHPSDGRQFLIKVEKNIEEMLLKYMQHRVNLYHRIMDALTIKEQDIVLHAFLLLKVYSNQILK